MQAQQKHLNYWIQQLETSRPAQFLCDKPRRTGTDASSDVGEVHIAITGPLFDDLKQFCQNYQVSPLDVLFTTFRATHFRLTGAEDATIGVLRSDSLQCLRTIVDDESFEQLMEQVRKTIATAFLYRSVPFEDVASELSKERSARNPLVRMLFALRSVSDIPMPFVSNVHWDVGCYISEDEHGFQISVNFNKKLFYEKTIQDMASVLLEILTQGLLHPSVSIATLPLFGCMSLLTEVAKRQHKCTDYPRDSSLMDLFRTRAASCPDTLAVKDSSEQITYAQLDQLSDQFALWLVRRGLTAESLIGLFAPRAVQTIVTIFGILKAKLAYVPLDINVPTSRAEAILSQIPGQKLVLVGENAPEFKVSRDDVQCVILTDVFTELARRDSISEESVELIGGPSATNLSHIFFTSGSTGRPKGVMTEHRNVVRLILQSDLTSLIQTGTKMAHIANIASDMSTTEIWAPLLNGGTLVCIDTLTTLDTARMYWTILQEDIRFVRFTPTLLHQCLIECPAMFGHLDFLMIGGDRLDPRDAQKLMTCTRATAFNIYGPTETTGFVAWYQIRKDDVFANGVPLGRCVDNAGLFVMDPKQRPVPDGVIGELVIVGDGLARSFLDPQQNESRFITILLGDHSARAYRTGDCVRRRASDGHIEFFGRIDHQVKVRGHRVELGEIEHILASNSLVDESVVVLRNNDDTLNQRLIGFVTLTLGEKMEHLGSADKRSPGSGSSGVARELRSYLQNQLPAHMVPSEIRILDRMPINANRKVDRKVLAEAASKADEGATQGLKPEATPRNYVERGVCEEFSAVLGFHVGICDSFFDLGGHSLMATMLVSRISKRFEARVSVKDLFDHPMVSALSRLILPRLGLAPYMPIRKLAYSGPVEQSFAQRRLWFMEQMFPDSTRYLLPYVWRLRGNLDLDALQSALDALTHRHESLRTTFEQEDDGEFQIIHSFSAGVLRVIEVSPQNRDDLATMLQQEQEKTFDLEASPGWRVVLYRLNAEDFVLSLVIHHIIADDWSIDVLRRELSTFYAAALNRKDALSQVSPLPIQYRDFASWEKEPEQASQQEKHLQFWTQQLEGSQPAQFPYDKPRPAELSENTGKVDVAISGTLFNELKTFCQIQQATIFAVLLSAFRATHFHLTGVRDATVGILNACRDRQELEGLIGFFVNLQCIRTVLDEETSFQDVVQRVQTTTTTAFLNQDVPFERIVTALNPADRGVSQNPLVQTVFTFHPQLDSGKLMLEGLTIEQMGAPRQIKFDLEFHLYLRQHGLEGYIIFAKDLFFTESIEKLVSLFNETLRLGIASDTKI